MLDDETLAVLLRRVPQAGTHGDGVYHDVCWPTRVLKVKVGTRRLSLRRLAWLLIRPDVPLVHKTAPWPGSEACRRVHCCNPWHASALHPATRYLVERYKTLPKEMQRLSAKLFSSSTLSHNATRAIDLALEETAERKARYEAILAKRGLRVG